MTDRDLKAAEIDFPECSLVDDGIGLEAEVLGAVAGKMLQRSADTFGLYAVDVVRGQSTGQERVFRIVFEVSAAERRTFDADAGAQQDGQTLRTALIAQLFAESFGALFVPCAGNGRRGRETDGFDLRSQLQQAQSMLAIARKRLDDCTIMAPCDGIV
ncbi:MAG: hypothetical protein II207_06315, partial [Clostridia bacterium]|nr:hypothetical protein [Clostridia bacterium]